MAIATIIAAVVIIIVGLYWAFRAQKKESHHLDGLHIDPTLGEKKKD